ncbi:hypothetical protein H1R20_g16679, partial [Candolleomyces eurysporus]
MPSSQQHRDVSPEDHAQPGSEESGEEHSGSGPRKKTYPLKSHLRRIIRSYKKYQLSEADKEFCREALKSWRKDPQIKHTVLLSQTTKKVLGLYQAKHWKSASCPRAKAIEEAVSQWFRQRVKNRRKAAKLGTKAYNGRSVWLSQNKEKINHKIAELRTREENEGKPTVALFQLGVTELMKELPEEEQADLHVVACEWNATGPAEEVQKK